MIRKKVFIKVIIYNQFAVAMKHDEMLYKSHVSLCTIHFFCCCLQASANMRSKRVTVDFSLVYRSSAPRRLLQMFRPSKTVNVGFSHPLL